MKIIVGSPQDGKYVIEASSESEYDGDCNADVEAIYFFLTHILTVACFNALVDKINIENETKK